jgi:crossover junction endodeoxyribonuclease RuvC
LKILGVDPGLRVTGYGVISVKRVKGALPRIEALDAGVIRTKESGGIAERLKSIHAGLNEVIEEFKPDVVAIEKLYAHYEHPATAILMGHARGVVCLLAGVHGLSLASLPSTQVKKAVTGHGHAAKGQVQRMVQRILGLKSLPEPADAADALAVAIAYASHLKPSLRGTK